MDGIEVKVSGDKLVMTIDLARQGKPSKTGKTILVASTHGSLPVDYTKRPGIKVMLNVTAPR